MIRPSIIARSARTAALCLPAPGALYRLPARIAWRLSSPDENTDLQQGETETVVTLLHGLHPARRYFFEAEGFLPVPFETAPCAGLVEAGDFGLLDGIAPDDLDVAGANATALAEAVAAVPKGGTLCLGPGLWTSLPVGLKGQMTLHLAEGATLQAPSGRTGWPALPAHDHRGRMLGTWEGLPAACFAAPVHAVLADNLVIEGRGVLDGSGDKGDWWSWPKETRDGARRPRGMHLISCRDVTLLGFTIRNAPSWTNASADCERLTAAGLTIVAPPDSPNTDGFRPGGLPRRNDYRCPFFCR